MRSISGLFLMAVIAVPAVVYQIGEMNAFELHSIQSIEDEKQAVRNLQKIEAPEAEQPLTQKNDPLTPLQRINEMPVEAWMEIKGIGQVTAERILSYRNEHGGFSSLEALLEVKGIGPAKYAAIVEWLEQQK